LRASVLYTQLSINDILQAYTRVKSVTWTGARRTMKIGSENELRKITGYSA